MTLNKITDTFMSEIQTLDRKQFVVGSKLVSELALLFTAYILFSGLLFLHFRVWEPDITRQVLGILALHNRGMN
ncbi:hypothetical protein [Cylindrospermopsis curvispora]|uniref:Uncharacterized protein n=1 Tax=Cylindrospermopsis curvispora GIHE-G1 TaxID=2666332 RepID=A0A7H0F1Q7_9CYAN|nr:hypothetical protein [Cylindrospermopsis curvispora]QNP29973.1 hypothetical protein IAR63_02460 [Cylindrospermopsis curvispora GIHE-G1]